MDEHDERRSPLGYSQGLSLSESVSPLSNPALEQLVCLLERYLTITQEKLESLSLKGFSVNILKDPAPEDETGVLNTKKDHVKGKRIPSVLVQQPTETDDSDQGLDLYLDDETKENVSSSDRWFDDQDGGSRFATIKRNKKYVAKSGSSASVDQTSDKSAERRSSVGAVSATERPPSQEEEQVSEFFNRSDTSLDADPEEGGMETGDGGSSLGLSDAELTDVDQYDSSENIGFTLASESERTESGHPALDNSDITPKEEAHSDTEARARHRKSNGELVMDADPEPVDLPKSVKDVKLDILESGIAVYPGCQDVSGKPLILIFCKHPFWETETFSSKELAKIILYYCLLAKSEHDSSVVTVIADARGSSLTALNALLQTLYTVEATSAEVLSMVHVLADKVAQSLLFKSSVFRPQSSMKIDLVTSMDPLYKFVDAKQLPPELGGTKVLFHEEWVHFRKKLEPFIRKCQCVAKNLVYVMKEVSSLETSPTTAKEALRLIEEHEQHIQGALDDHQMVSLQVEGEAVIDGLEHDMNLLTYCSDCGASVQKAKHLFRQVKQTAVQLVRLTDSRMHHLEQCLQLRQFEQASSQVIAWLSAEGKSILIKHETISDGLKAITAQQKDFEKHYFAAMTQLEKAQDLLEEASMLTQSGDYDEVTGIREIARDLKARVRSFAGRLEETRFKIEDTHTCYHLMDKAYEWALNAMKYVAGMKMDSSMSASGVDRLLTSIEKYLQEHPPITQDAFDKMTDLSSKLGNVKLQEQCRVARTRCLETIQLLKVRQSTLRRARTHLEMEQLRRNSMCVGAPIPARGSYEPPELRDSRGAHVLPPVVLRRRSFAGKPSSPNYGPTVGAFKDNLRDAHLADYQEKLFQEGLITEDMSDRIVANLPKSLADSALRGSRESLRGSRESLRGSNENLGREHKSSSVPKELPGTPQGPSLSPVSGVVRRQHGGSRRHMHRVNSLQIDSKGEVLDSTGQFDLNNLRSLSMITGSTESLPSMLDEDRGLRGQIHRGESEDDHKHVWSPVPVNTHIMSRSGRGLTSYSSMADLRMTEEEVKRRRTLMMIMREMIQTEEDYVQSLQFVIDNYIPEMLREDVPQVLRGKRSIVFGNLEQIFQFHNSFFLAELQQCEDNPFHICHCFLQHEKEFYLYALYNKNKPKSDELMMEYGRYFFKTKQTQLGDRLDLSSYLLKPVQRMGKYALLLKQIIKECPESDPDYQELRAALDMVRFQLRHGNDLLAMDSLKDCDVSLPEQGRLLRQDEFLVWQGRRKCLRHVFLFEEMVLFSKTKRTGTGHDVYIYKSSIKTSDLGLTETVGDSGYRFELWFRKRTQGVTYILQAASSEVKKCWVNDITRILWKQAIRNREHRMSEMAQMGIGNKPCLDLKRSSDNINDRFVSLGNRAPRTRNSVAVSSFDYLKDGARRPHSIISVSSSSSSNSSKSSGYVSCDSSLSQSQDDSKLFTGRASTVCSAESGIASDLSPEGSIPNQPRNNRYSSYDRQTPGGSSPASPSSPMSLVHEVIAESDV